MSNRRRHIGSRDAPESSNCVGVFGLSLYTTERELEKEFSKFGPLEKVTVVLDGKVINYKIKFLFHTIRKVKFLSRNSILTKPQHFHEFFTPNLF